MCHSCDFRELSSLQAREQIIKISLPSCVVPCLAMCCPFAAGAVWCVKLPRDVKDICPLYNNTVEGCMPEIDWDAVIQHFKASLMTEFSPLSRILVFPILFPLCSLTEFFFPCCDVFFSVYAACHHVYLLHHQEWSTFFKCTKMPAHPQVSLFPPSPTSHLSGLSPSFPPHLLLHPRLSLYLYFSHLLLFLFYIASIFFSYLNLF